MTDTLFLVSALSLAVKRKKSSKPEAKGTVSKVTGKKITKIMGLGKKKPSTDEQTSSAEEDVPTCGKAAAPAGTGSPRSRPPLPARRLRRAGSGEAGSGPSGWCGAGPLFAAPR